MNPGGTSSSAPSARPASTVCAACRRARSWTARRRKASAAGPTWRAGSEICGLDSPARLPFPSNGRPGADLHGGADFCPPPALAPPEARHRTARGYASARGRFGGPRRGPERAPPGGDPARRMCSKPRPDATSRGSASLPWGRRTRRCAPARRARNRAPRRPIRPVAIRRLIGKPGVA